MRAVVVEFFSQIIVFLFLIDSDTSLLVSIPAFCAIIIQMWKVQKALGLTIGDPPVPSYISTPLKNTSNCGSPVFILCGSPIFLLLWLNLDRPGGGKGKWTLGYVVTCTRLQSESPADNDDNDGGDGDNNGGDGDNNDGDGDAGGDDNEDDGEGDSKRKVIPSRSKDNNKAVGEEQQSTAVAAAAGGKKAGKGSKKGTTAAASSSASGATGASSSGSGSVPGSTKAPSKPSKNNKNSNTPSTNHNNNDNDEDWVEVTEVNETTDTTTVIAKSPTNTTEELTRVTLEADRIATTYLGMLLTPVILGDPPVPICYPYILSLYANTHMLPSLHPCNTHCTLMYPINNQYTL